MTMPASLPHNPNPGSIAFALLRKNRAVLLLFLVVGLVLSTLGAVAIGYERAFIYPPFVDESWFHHPQFRSKFPLGLTQAFMGCLFGWVAGSTDRLRGLNDYLYQRSTSTAWVFFGQLGWFLLVMLGWMILPWCLVAVFGGSSFPAEHLALGLPRMAAGSIALPCFSCGFFLAHGRSNIALRLMLTAPLMWLLIGRVPSDWMAHVLEKQPWMSVVRNLLWSALLIGGAWASFLAGTDRDTPNRKPAVVSLGVLLVVLCLPWQQVLQTASWTAMGNNYVATDGEGSFFIATYREVRKDAGQPSHGLMGSQTVETVHYRVDPETHEPAEVIPAPRHVRFKTINYPSFPENFFSMALHVQRGDEVRGDKASPFDSVRTYAGHPKGHVSHFITTQSGETGKIVLDRNGQPFSRNLYILPNTGSTIWLGDAKDQTIWFADLTDPAPHYEQALLPEGFAFKYWASPETDLEERLRASIPGKGPLAFIPCAGKHAALDLDSKKVVALTPEQEQWVQDVHLGVAKGLPSRWGHGPVGRIYPQPLNFFGVHEEVHDEDGVVLFAHDLTAKTLREKLWVAARLGVSALAVPALQPGSFGMTRQRHMYPPFRSQTALNYDTRIGFATSPGFLSSWIGPSLDWRSIPFWLLLAGLAWAMRRRLQKLGATGPRLWIWPLAIMSFGVLGALACLITERRRAYLPAAKEMGAEAPEPLLKSA